MIRVYIVFFLDIFVLAVTVLWADSAEDKFMIFSQKIQSLFSGKTYFKTLPAEFFTQHAKC